jgi:methylenetetrahydrofolate--tRNA-(uracil-5-)-methyltransferase
MGSLCHYVAHADPKRYQPVNIAFDVLPPLDEDARLKLKRDKKARHAEVCRRAERALEEWLRAG